MIKKLLFKLIPRSWYVAYIHKKNDRYGKMDTQKVFSEVYEKKIWSQGNYKDEDFCSGSGTTNSNTQQYIQFLQEFIKSKAVKSIVEIGCGDFRIMNEVLTNVSVDSYEGLDIVPDLIKRNREKFGNGVIQFTCINAVVDAVPKGDCLIVRQVLQHLNNVQIKSILGKAQGFKYILVTEHIPKNERKPNEDKVQGPETRLNILSGVFIEKPPFNILHAKTVFQYDENYGFMNGEVEAVMRTSLVDNS